MNHSSGSPCPPDVHVSWQQSAIRIEVNTIRRNKKEGEVSLIEKNLKLVTFQRKGSLY